MEKNKKNEKKRKLRTLILLLFLTIIMFGTSTYAWFTANRVVTINALDVHVEASNGIQISTDGVTWKSVITRTDIISGAYEDNVNQLPTNVTAVSTIPVANSTGETQGRLNMYSAVIDTDATSGDYTIETILEEDTKGQTGKYIAFDIFLRVDTNQAVYLASGSDVTVATGSEEKGLKNAARVAFIKLGNVAATSTQAQITELNTPAGVILWEPNIDAHEDIIITSVAPDMGVSISQSGTAYARVAYRGVDKATTTALDLKQVVNGTNTSITTAVTPDITTTEGNTAYNTFATLTAGVTKYRVYMWIEGQDIDCDNSATGTNISYKIVLSTLNGSSSGSAAAASSSSGA